MNSAGCPGAHDPVDLARSLARMPMIYHRLLEAHRPGPDGRCLGCRWQVRDGQRWPCLLHQLASAARQITEAGGGPE